MVEAQKWLEENYPNKEKTRSIYLNQQLTGVLDCQEYEYLEHIFISTSIDSSKFEIKGGFYKDWRNNDKIKETAIIPCLSVQTYLDQRYPTQQARARETAFYTWKKGLEGNLDLSDFPNLEKLSCSDNYLTTLNLNNCQQLKEIKCSDNQLTTLNLSNLEQLKKLDCSDNYLTQIVYPTNPEKITDLDIRNNNLSPSELTIFSQMRNLGELYIGNWDKIKFNQGIYNRWVGSCEPLKDLSKLGWLFIENTDLTSGWEYLPDSLKVFHYKSELRPSCQLAQAQTELEKELWIDIHKEFAPKYKKDWLDQGFNKEQTKEWIEAGAKYDDVEFINWFLNFKKLDLNWALENEEEFGILRDGHHAFGTCLECQQPNVSYEWCQSCNAKHFEEEFNNWTSGSPQIDKFIQKCQLEATSDWNLLEWIPYEKFTNIEHIADGGFGKIDKAQWKEGSIVEWNNEEKKWKRNRDYEQQEKYKDYQTVALKTLSNSQHLNQNFLQELTLYKMFRSSVSRMVPCYGISQDREGNYIMVMQYMTAGNLREYLRKNYRELKFYNDDILSKKSKLDFLKQIIQGLKDIHRKQLVHRDFHSGNIIIDEDGSCRITDLGLSKPVNEVATGDKIYGIMPYVAPEVLKGQPYTPASDIYSLGIIMYEILTGYPPFAKEAHDVNSALKICQGIRPQFPRQIKYPQILVDLIKQCWDGEPDNRPTAREISRVVVEWFDEDDLLWIQLKKDTKFYQQIQEAEEFNRTLSEEIRYPNYQDNNIWHSKPINTKQIITKLSEYQASKDLELDINDLNLDELNIQDPQEQSSTQAQIEIPPKNRN